MKELRALESVIDEVVRPQAVVVDRDGEFPRKAIDALAEAGFLGLVSATDVGGGGGGLAEAVAVVERLGAACGSTAMVVLMHYAAVAVVEAYGAEETRREIAAGRHLTTLAFSEAGSRSHFWVPLGTAAEADGSVRLDARKSWVTSADEADSYVWSSRSLGADGAMTLWLVPAATAGLRPAGGFDGMGLRGNASRPITADGALVPAEAALGADGAGLDIALERALPWFLVLSSAFCAGLMRSTVDEAVAHLTSARLDHLGQTLAEQPVVRLEIARMRLAADGVSALLADTLTALGTGRDDAMVRVLEAKAVAAEAAIDVTDRAMKACGGAAFRKELGIERSFRDARAARVMAPTTDTLLDFIGRVTCGQPLFGDA
ncbi:acyl-CoA dehydrogenase family protein [Actinomadura sp. HBU206391]|uniref:acyl-CoA dehydrogenase family protein n=1 Tax=Actinomadura sp. HBU206391 TaxID=2731692 RepID=UPI00165064A8|nr:acyl-CoA dehydrogenase family protein [Actinomadura sp. HBU206391]MBC6462600.1 acyl-CoA/acyl-ACP dehydrogenase [Actinomadura sp. HBU206391]